MPNHLLVDRAAGPMRATVAAITADQLHAPTPCHDYDIRRLLNHLLYWGPSFEGAARKVGAPPSAPDEQTVDLVGDDWVGAMDGHLDRLVASWGEPSAWMGTTRFGRPDPVPAPLIGGMLLTELVVHGWDLARASGRWPRWDDETLDAVHRELVNTAEQGRQMGVYGPPVPVPDTAPVLERALGLTGRDPAWAPGAGQTTRAS